MNILSIFVCDFSKHFWTNITSTFGSETAILPQNSQRLSIAKIKFGFLPLQNRAARRNFPEFLDGVKTVRCKRSKSRLLKCRIERSVLESHGTVIILRLFDFAIFFHGCCNFFPRTFHRPTSNGSADLFLPQTTISISSSNFSVDSDNWLFG